MLVKRINRFKAKMSAAPRAVPTIEEQLKMEIRERCKDNVSNRTVGAFGQLGRHRSALCAGCMTHAMRALR